VKDRWGKPVKLDWPAHHELWVLAAIELPVPERIHAFDDIAAMTGRSYASIQWKATELRKMRYAADAAARAAAHDAVTALARKPSPAPLFPPSTINTSAKALALRTGSRA